MRLLIIINSLGTGGAEKLVTETIPIFIEKGIDVELLLLNGKKHPFFNELIKNEKCKIHSLGMGSVYNPLLIFKTIPFLKNCDIVHVHLFPALYWVAIAKMISFSKNIFLFTEHNTTNKRRGKFYFSHLDRLIYDSYFKIITISEKVEKNLKDYLGIKFAKRILLIKNGVNLETIKQFEKTDRSLINGLTIDNKVLIQVSRFHQQKDQHTLIKALKFLPDYVKLLLVGDGELRQECEHLVNELGLQDRVLFLGIRMDVPGLLKIADIVVLSTKYEGLSLSSVEGLASGKPFIASDVPGLSEVVKGHGLLFPQGDTKALANHILALLSDPKYYKRIASACLKRSKKYDIHKMVEKHIDLYESVMSKKSQ